MLTQLTIDGLNRRMAKSEEKYGPIRSQAEAIGALKLEVWEVMEAMHERQDEWVYGEMLDVANVAIRWAQRIKETSEKCTVA